MRTKEEILASIYSPNSFGVITDKQALQVEICLDPSIETISKAMDEYAKEVAINFIKWAVEKCSQPYEGFSFNKYTDGREDSVYINHDEFPITQIFDLFIKVENNIP